MRKKGKRATMQQVAELAGVSRTTVSFVLNDKADSNIPPETRQRVLDAARKLNYVPDAKAVTLVKGRTNILGLVILQTVNNISANAFLGEYLHSLVQTIEPAGYHVLVHPAEPARTYGHLARSQRVDGLIVFGPLVDDAELQALQEEGAFVVTQGTSHLAHVPSVDIDNVQSAMLAVEYLIELGHRRIGHITNAPLNHTSARDRLAGYRRALDRAGIPYDENLVCEGALIDESGYNAMCGLLDLPHPPTAVFVGSDVVALGALEAIRERDLSVPDDISIVGFDDILLSRYLSPALTTVHIPINSLANEGGKMLLQLIQGKPLTQDHVLLESELIIRDSAGPPSAQAHKHRLS
jgi:LacI family transcriptional regulator